MNKIKQGSSSSFSYILSWRRLRVRCWSMSIGSLLTKDSCPRSVTLRSSGLFHARCFVSVHRCSPSAEIDCPHTITFRSSSLRAESLSARENFECLWSCPCKARMSKPYKFLIFVLDHVRHGCLRTRVPLPVGFFFLYLSAATSSDLSGKVCVTAYKGDAYWSHFPS